MRKPWANKSFLGKLERLMQLNTERLRIERDVENEIVQKRSLYRLEDNLKLLCALSENSQIREADKKLRNFMCTMTNEELALVEAIMLVGRERMPKMFKQYYQDALRDLEDHRDGEIDYILFKSPVLNQYLRNGLKLLLEEDHHGKAKSSKRVSRRTRG
jgi:hypothetical protein